MMSLDKTVIFHTFYFVAAEPCPSSEIAPKLASKADDLEAVQLPGEGLRTLGPPVAVPRPSTHGEEHQESLAVFNALFSARYL